LGVKRAAYALITGQRINTKLALAYDLVNEIMPKDQLLDRAWKLADHIYEPAAGDAPSDDADHPASLETTHCRQPGPRLWHSDVRSTNSGW
jgi:enoyl-CoA hydratase/carnithine racemase